MIMMLLVACKIILIMIMMLLVACNNTNTLKNEQMNNFNNEEKITVQKKINPTTTEITTEIKETETEKIIEVEEITTIIETTKIEVPTTIPSNTFDSTYILNKITELRKLYPNGKYWNNSGVTNIPCNHKQNGYINCNIYKGVINNVFPYKVVGRQCLGFASMCSDYIFGKNAITRVFYDYDSLDIGDFIRTNNDYHSAIVISKNDKYITVAECNADFNSCIISWDRQITKEYLASTNSWYIKRY